MPGVDLHRLGEERSIAMHRAIARRLPSEPTLLAATIADDDEIIVVGSQAILGQFPSPPAELCVSNEAEFYPKNHPERADLMDGSIGGLSLLVSKYVAGREKDRRFARDAIRHGLVDQAILLERLANAPIDDSIRRRIGAFVGADFAANSK